MGLQIEQETSKDRVHRLLFSDVKPGNERFYIHDRPGAPWTVEEKTRMRNLDIVLKCQCENDEKACYHKLMSAISIAIRSDVLRAMGISEDWNKPDWENLAKFLSLMPYPLKPQ